ncbi:unnamed protein product [Caenorhabditis auriculariae]|uniref:Clc-like protein n=1 Tax=Caenorhabditis auriculariae TaxID=2777116 RepID=A0A8S1HL50_9PELO|nr:unnamed protein product [Caenorhabditis auriculariae]
MALVMYKLLLITSILLIVVGVLLTGFSLFSPIWEVVDFPREHLSHQHGLWWDCIVHHNTLIPLHELQAEQRGDRCDSKLDPTVRATLRVALDKGDKASRELLLHRFLPHHKGVIFFAVFTFVFGGIGILIGSCSPCFPPNALLYVVAIFMTSACSIMGDVIYMFAFNKSQEEEPSIDETQYEEAGRPLKRLGIASFIHMTASLTFVFAFLTSIFCAYFLVTSKHARDACCTSKKEYQEQTRWKSSGLILKTGNQSQLCRPFVVIDDDSSI